MASESIELIFTVVLIYQINSAILSDFRIRIYRLFDELAFRGNDGAFQNFVVVVVVFLVWVQIILAIILAIRIAVIVRRVVPLAAQFFGPAFVETAYPVIIILGGTSFWGFRAAQVAICQVIRNLLAL